MIVGGRFRIGRYRKTGMRRVRRKGSDGHHVRRGVGTG